MNRVCSLLPASSNFVLAFFQAKSKDVFMSRHEGALRTIYRVAAVFKEMILKQQSASLGSATIFEVRGSTQPSKEDTNASLTAEKTTPTEIVIEGKKDFVKIVLCMPDLAPRNREY